jgi:hypothetical protein
MSKGCEHESSPEQARPKPICIIHKLIWYQSLKGTGMVKKYIVSLSEVERESLEQLVKTGKRAAYTINHARILNFPQKSGYSQRVENRGE